MPIIGAGLQIILPKGVTVLSGSPSANDISFDDWWETTNDRVSGLVREGLNSIIIFRSMGNLESPQSLRFYGVLRSLNEVSSCVVDGKRPTESS